MIGSGSSRDWGSGVVSGHQMEHLAAELLGITLRYGHGSFIGRRDRSRTSRLYATQGTSPAFAGAWRIVPDEEHADELIREASGLYVPVVGRAIREW